MHERDVTSAAEGQADNAVDGLVDGIMEQLDNTEPNHSGIATAPEEVPEVQETPQTPDEPEKYTIKWQGQDREVTQDELLDLAQKGFDYTQKTMTLAQERDQLSPYVGLANLIKSDPVKATQIAAILSGQAPQKEAESDPIEQLKAETIAEFRKELASAITPLHRQQALNQVKQSVQADPDYARVHAQIINMVKSQPPSLQKNMFLQLDQDPASYLDAFQYFKNQVPKGETTLPPPTKKSTHAPILESGGVEAPEGMETKAKSERIAKQKAKALRSGDPTEIASWLQSSGALDHLY